MKDTHRKQVKEGRDGGEKLRLKRIYNCHVSTRPYAPWRLDEDGRGGGGGRELCGQLSSCGWRRCKLLGVKRSCINRQNIADSACSAPVKGVQVPAMQIGADWVLLGAFVLGATRSV